MRKSYRALAIMATLAIIAAALHVLMVEQPMMWIISRIIGPVNGVTATHLYNTLIFILGVMSQTIATLVTAALVFAIVLAAQTGRKWWLGGIIIVSLLVVYWEFLVYAPFYLPFVSKAAQTNLDWLSNAQVYCQAVVSLIALSLALAFALTGMRQARALADAAQ